MAHANIKLMNVGFALCLMTGALAGCNGSGNMDVMKSLNAFNSGSQKYDVAYLKNTLIPGKTTKYQVQQLFGAPAQQSLDSTSRSNGSNWTYSKSEEGLDKYMALAHKYVSTENSLKMYNATAQLSKAQGVMNDVGGVAGVTAPSGQPQGSQLIIYFKDDVVDYYRLY